MIQKAACLDMIGQDAYGQLWVQPSGCLTSDDLFDDCSVVLPPSVTPRPRYLALSTALIPWPLPTLRYELLKSNQVDEASMTDLSRLVFKIIPYDKSEVIQMMYKLLYLESQLEAVGLSPAE